MWQDNFCLSSSSWKKGNITLLVIFILLASALMSLLAMTQLKNMMKYGETTNNFFKAYYLAKAGLELALTEVSTRDVGFQIVHVNSGDVIVSGNLNTPDSPYVPYRSWTMYARSTGMEVELGPKENITIPLFLDQTSTHLLALGDGIPLENLDFVNNKIQNMRFEEHEKPVDPYMVSVFSYSGDQNIFQLALKTDDSGINGIWQRPAVENFLKSDKAKNARTYLVIFNQDTQNTGSFRIDWSNEFGLRTTDITSLGHYGDTEIGTHATLTEKPPSWSF